MHLQDALACVVADEMQKIYQVEMGPERIPSTVHADAIDEEVSVSYYFCLEIVSTSPVYIYYL